MQRPEQRPERPSDDELMRELAGGCERAMEALVVRHRDRVARLGAWLTGDPARGEDVAQETFLRVFRHARAYEGRGQFTAWLATIASRLSRNALRGERRRPEAPLETAGLEAAPASADALLELRDVRARLARLPERQRRALLLKAAEGRSYREIAATLACSESDVANAIFRARKALAGR